MLWRRKSKDEKILEEIKKKKAEIDKLKEEIVQMGKLVLKDGKLQRVEDVKKEDVPSQQVPPSATTESFDKLASQVVDKVLPPLPTPPEPPKMFRQQEQPRSMPSQYASPKPTVHPDEDVVYVKPPQAPPVQQPPQFSQQDLQQMLQQQQMREQYEQMQLQQQRMQQLQLQQELQERIAQQQLAQQQYEQQQAQLRQQVSALPPVVVNIELVNGSVVQLDVDREKIDSFVDEVNTAIDNQSSIPLGNKVINGRNVVLYTFE